MRKPSTLPPQLNKMHRDFRDAYQFLNDYVKELYELPKKFVEEAEPTMERYMKEYGIPGEPRKNIINYPDVVDFVDQLDDLTLETLLLFEKHKAHFEKSILYLRKVAGLKSTVENKKTTPEVTEKQLIRELNRLNLGLMDIKEDADDMLGKMEKLELRWGKLKQRLKS